jgi:bifunctional lysine-specific demethylase and histidyl-hydroxylase NO66
LRSGFPLGLDISDPEQLAQELTATAEALRSWLVDPDPDAVAAQVRRHEWQAARPAPIRPLAQAAALAGLDADTVLSARGGLRWRISATTHGRITLQLPDRTLTVPSICEPAIRALLAGPGIRVGDLPGLDADDRLTLARRLLREAVAVPAEKN